MGFMLHRETPRGTLFAGSGALFEGRVALGRSRTAAFGPPGRSPAGFRWPCGRPQRKQKRQNPATDPPRGRQVAGGLTPLPGKPPVGHARSRQAQLREGYEHPSQLQRSACSGWRTRGVVHPKVCLRKRKVCSRSKLRA